MKKIISALVIILVLSTATYATEQEFSDLISTHWAFESIKWGVDNKIVSGYPDGTYRPTEQITEEQFATVLAKYVFKDKNLQNSETGGWSNNYYMELFKYSLPFKGYSDESIRSKPLTRGQIAQIIAAKNGFNLNERQAIYYMYENDISYGVVDGELSFKSYGSEQYVSREQIPAFFQRLVSAGHTTFMGKPSTVATPEKIGGITNIAKENKIIPDAMFAQLKKDKGIVSYVPSVTLGTLENPIVVNAAGQTDGQPFYDLALAHRDRTNNIIGKINGIITPIDINVTGADLEDKDVLHTSLSSTSVKSGYHDKEMFIKIVDEHWKGTIIDENQANHIKGLIKYLDNTDYSSSGLYVVKGSINDVVIAGNRSRVNVNIYAKGWVDATGIEVRP